MCRGCVREGVCRGCVREGVRECVQGVVCLQEVCEEGRCVRSIVKWVLCIALCRMARV